MSGRRLLYRDREYGIVMGVCAGVADYFNLSLFGVRLVTLIALLIFTVPMLLVYFTAGILLRDRPLCYSGRDNEPSFWRRHRRSVDGEAGHHG